MNELNYVCDPVLTAEQVADLFRRSTIRRPIDDMPRIAKMVAASDLTVAAFDGDLLVGYSRSLTDFCFCCYLSDLAVDEKYQHKGIGKKLVEITRDRIGDKAALILLASPAAMGYYPKIGFELAQNAFIIKRTE